MSKLEVGAWNKLPHYAVIGEPVEFYVWVNEDDRGLASNWIKGREAFDLYFKLKSSNKSEFIKLIKKIAEENKRQ